MTHSNGFSPGRGREGVQRSIAVAGHLVVAHRGKNLNQV